MLLPKLALDAGAGHRGDELPLESQEHREHG
jgi:hypothetical protein